MLPEVQAWIKKYLLLLIFAYDTVIQLIIEHI